MSGKFKYLFTVPLLSTLLGLGLAVGTRACTFDLPFVPGITLFAQESSSTIPREVYLPLHANSSDCLHRSRSIPTLPGILYT
jgi:hypothetical protein